MWLPQKISHICSSIDFFHKLFHDFEVKNSVFSEKRIEISEIRFFSIMSWLSVNSFVLSLDWKIWILPWNHLGVAREVFETCSAENFTKWTHKIVVGKYWIIKLRKIDTEDMDNELACGSND